MRGGDCSASPSKTDAAMPPPADYCAGKGNAATIGSKDVMPLPTFDHHHHHHRGGAHERDQRGSSPEDPPPHHVPQGWLHSKVPKFLPAKGPEPVPEAATMRKARVSVRARSEAAMVSRQWFSLSGLLGNKLVFVHLFKCLFLVTRRSVMDASGGSTGRRWPRATRAPARTTGARWPPAARSASRYADGS